MEPEISHYSKPATNLAHNKHYNVYDVSGEYDTEINYAYAKFQNTLGIINSKLTVFYYDFPQVVITPSAFYPQDDARKGTRVQEAAPSQAGNH